MIDDVVFTYLLIRGWDLDGQMPVSPQLASIGFGRVLLESKSLGFE